MQRQASARIFVCILALAGMLAPVCAVAQSRSLLRRVQDSPRQDRAQRPPNRPGLNQFIERLMQLEPTRRREMLANNRRYQRLPEAQRREIERRLEEFDKLPLARREMLIQRFQLFSRLRPEQQAEARRLYRAWSQLPRDRRLRITQAVQRLHNADPEARRHALESERFAELYDNDDRSLIEGLLSLRPEPDAGQGPLTDKAP